MVHWLQDVEIWTQWGPYHLLHNSFSLLAECLEFLSCYRINLGTCLIVLHHLVSQKHVKWTQHFIHFILYVYTLCWNNKKQQAFLLLTQSSVRWVSVHKHKTLQTIHTFIFLETMGCTISFKTEPFFSPSAKHIQKLWRISSKHGIPVHFKPKKTLRQTLVHPEDKSPKNKLHGAVQRPKVLNISLQMLMQNLTF